VRAGGAAPASSGGVGFGHWQTFAGWRFLHLACNKRTHSTAQNEWGAGGHGPLLATRHATRVSGTVLTELRRVAEMDESSSRPVEAGADGDGDASDHASETAAAPAVDGIADLP